MRITFLLCVAAFCGCGTPALIKDARQGSMENIQRTLGRGTPKARLLDGALCEAATHGHTDAVRALLQAGARIEGQRAKFLAMEADIGCYMQGAWSKYICGKGVSRPDGVGRGDIGMVPTPLGCAALYGRKETVEFLLSQGANPNPTPRGRATPPPITMAAMRGHAGIVRILLDHGADPFLVAFHNPRTAYDWAAKLGHAQVAAMLKEDMERRRPGAVARQGGGSSGLKLLGQVMNAAGAFIPGLSQASDLINKAQTGVSVVQAGQAVYQAARPAGAATAAAPLSVDAEPKLHESAAGEDVGALRRLLAEGADVDERCALGATPLMHAAAGENAELVKALLDARAGVNARDARGVTALMIASLAGRPEAVLALLAAGADPNLKAKSGGTALSLAEAAGHGDIAALLNKAGAGP